MTLKGLKLRIYPNQAQQLKIKMNFGYNRFVWNQMLNMLIKRHENNPQAPLLNVFALNSLLPTMKLEHSWLKEAESTSLQSTCHDLVGAFQKFFKEPDTGFPKFKSRKYPKQSYNVKFSGASLAIKNEHTIRIPKIGLMPFKTGRAVTGKIKNATIRLSTTGKYYAMVLVETNVNQLAKTGQAVGIDLGVADLIITSRGRKYSTIRFDKMLAKKKYYWEKRLARRGRQAKREMAWDKHNHVPEPRELSDFKNYQKAKLMVAKYNERIANQRRNYLHNLTKQLVEQYDVINIEDLKTKNLLKNHHLARAIANQSWREIRRQLKYKCAWYGKQLVIVNPRKTSQLCFNCGYDDGKHPLAIRKWTCPRCGMVHDRDINAARNILKATA
ncbi:RNA-guided endonuclease TnpB family protein [Levilactobacillus hammesii]|uniref:Transposase, IS605 OrfB family n=1 Tax=Levilactobacillus hammesii DSM 16381 TaxID=1423753 RepID=A0A0R1UTL6_9LACO|nr:RNA-guided endonuclease TnpB family protein [Levilactobacillus hammesii]KRL93323.1 transposase, IS605 OrfB family [Levilactobacillus hammesii DSM 16381]